MEKKLLKFSPLTEATFYILLSLVHPLHGYGIIKKVEELMDGRLIIAAGTLYGAITILLQHKLIKLYSDELDSKKKKLYLATQSGKELLHYEIERLQEMVLHGQNEVNGNG